MKPIYIVILTVLTALSACSKKDDAPQPQAANKATLSLQFDNIAGDRNLQLNTGTYKNASGEQFTVQLLQYFISNIKVRTKDDQEFIVPQDESYFLVKESDGASQFCKVKVPEGDYKTLTFTLGVDSLRNTMDISKRTGVLDPTGGMDDGMYWGWNSGYIFFKMEGTSEQAPIDPTGVRKFRFHIGGFGGYSAPTFNNIKTVTVDLSAAGIARVRQGRESNVHFFVDIMKMFNGKTNISIAANPQVMFSNYSVNVANNFSSMFYHDHTEN
ncbi:hypothetical protein HDE68_002522 [Pedobacter cryoconitis]|uniref:Copper-binding protein MbnP-like domain-containing protein n=1 Tax=Pedobacter cryoconitis TaxID=188932 RepID=A0A7W9DZ47_9SPHI|nr:MbnP family protein [Pedobacter cryoconitis]MBB5636621.1 hypothetical protein [Pedobacter cryoconitis]